MPRMTPNPGRGQPPRRDIERPSRLKLWARRQRRNLRFVGFGISGFAMVMLGVLIVHSAQTGGLVARLQDRFARNIDLRVQDITIVGRANTPEPLLRAALGVSVGDPILGFSVEAARARIETLSWVGHVAVERRLPGTIYLALTERRPFAIWQDQGKFQLIDHDGAVVLNEDVANFTDLPLVVGDGAAPPAPAMLDQIATLPDLKIRVAALIRVGDRRWNLQLRNNVTVMLPEGHEAEALQRLVQLQASQTLLDRPLVFIDLRLPDRLAVRPRPVDQATTPPATVHPAKAELKRPDPIQDLARPDISNRRAT